MRSRVTFYDPGPLEDGDLELVLERTYRGSRSLGLAPAYAFSMRQRETGVRMGDIDLRLSNDPYIVLYAGHIGYGVERAYRGHRYAARACRLLLPLAKAHGLDPLWITCNPDNLASRRTCELAGATLVEIVEVPPGTDLYRRGEREKCRYRIDLATVQRAPAAVRSAR
ncbi:GCN5-related N-acetyltransferase [Truepera radiovictrix DSM 17093]|uniref:GCN5-related N-acetyltransferase n=1 Tax=Truepera radiovictrix (strain DSM 17093 / CIP 108686 / LMG 22925 / RQ-24) TaxID=649638 RepID=D7CRF6_TRURR|nr:GCN5-related N-acetyltransferase [Truepera radiovictrix DSM 17093]